MLMNLKALFGLLYKHKFKPYQKFKTYLPYAFIILFCSLFYGMARDGADFGRYIDWSVAIKESNIFKLQGDTLSPMGVPLSQWSFGPGILFLVGNIFFKDLIKGALFVGWIFTIILWWALFGTLYYVSHKKCLFDTLWLFNCVCWNAPGFLFYSLFI